MAASNENTPTGSATRHAVTGIVASIIAAFVARKNLPVPPEAVSESANWITGVGVAVAAAAAGAVGSLWRKLIGG